MHPEEVAYIKALSNTLEKKEQDEALEQRIVELSCQTDMLLRLVKAAKRVVDAEDRGDSRYLADILDPLEDAIGPFFSKK